MTDVAAHAEPHVEVDVSAQPVEENTAAAEQEATFSTAVEPSDAPVLNADDTPLEAAVVEETTTTEVTEVAVAAEAEGEEAPPTSNGSDKKSKSWIAKLTSNIKKLADKKPKAEKPAATDAETPAATEDAAAPAEAEAEAETEAVAETTVTETVVVEESPVPVVVEEAAPAAAEAPAAEEKPQTTGTELTVEEPAPQKLGKRLSFNFFKKSNKADKE
ncbi:hypothetical protein BGZ80_009073 [Entomortierella chlamydospora]|uniref:Uncharacterized protein n=1 Tax=Entomortierella chlamydospora TaxID=101097 RepID=A0A9P6MXQ9_9FUNG|nr:hypothetical protein BGZ80_009073 [Entomortierella chlamydospora]